MESLLFLSILALLSSAWTQTDAGIDKVYYRLKASEYLATDPEPDTHRLGALHYQFRLYQLTGVDDASQTMELRARLKDIWYDERLAWNTTGDPNDAKIIRLFDKQESNYDVADQLWQPKIRIQQCLGQPTLFADTQIKIASNGEVKRYQYVLLKITCSMFVADFPFDKQSCDLTFACDNCYSATKNETVPYMKFDNRYSNITAQLDRYYNLSGEQENNKFVLVNITARMGATPIVKINIRRRGVYELYYLFTPVLIIGCVSLLQFMLPADSGERVTLGVTCLLSMTVFMIVLQENLSPDVEDSIPLLGKYFGALMASVMIETAMSTIVVALHYRAQDIWADKASLCLVVFFWFLAWLLRMRQSARCLKEEYRRRKQVRKAKNAKRAARKKAQVESHDTDEKATPDTENAMELKEKLQDDEDEAGEHLNNEADGEDEEKIVPPEEIEDEESVLKKEWMAIAEVTNVLCASATVVLIIAVTAFFFLAHLFKIPTKLN